MPGSDEDWNAASEHAGAIGPDGEVDPDAEVGIEGVLGFELPAPVERARRSRMNMATAGLAVLTLVAGAFYAGVVVEKSHAKSSTTNDLAAAFASRFGGAAGARRTGATGTGATGGAGAAGAGAAAAAGVTVGTVKLVDGRNVYVTDTAGGITKVVTSSASTITVSTTGKVSQLKPGDTVIVRGAAGSDGTVTATSVTDSGAGGAGGFGGGFGARPATTTPAG